MTADITTILLNYRRPQNLPLLIEALKEQAVSSAIMVINNHGESRCFAGADRDVHIPWNAGCFARLAFLPWVRTPWVAFMDDDALPADPNFMSDALTIAEGRPIRAITGAFGRWLGTHPPHYHGQPDVTGRTPIIKGRFMLFRRQAVGLLHVPCLPIEDDADYLIRCDDLYLSLELGRGNPIHWADEGLQDRIEDLPGEEVGLDTHPSHYLIRERFCAYYVNHVLGSAR